jgi:hypothetical protein
MPRKRHSDRAGRTARVAEPKPFSVVEGIVRASLLVTAVWACVTVVAPARVSAQDSLSGLRGLLEERQHKIDVTLAPGHATLLVQRTVENLGRRHDQADWQIILPGTAVATQLRTRGVLDGVPRWFVGELMEAEEAARKYRELTGVGGYTPKDPALLSWRSQGHLALQVFPVPPGERKTISYTLKMPTEYHDGRHELTIPMLGGAGAPTDVVIRPRDEHDRLLVNGQPFPAGGRLAGDPGETRIALVPAWAPAVSGALGGTRLSADRTLVHYRIDAAPRLGRVPRDAQVVVILDWSRSLDQSLCQAGVAGAAAFLRHFEGASVEVLTVDRQAHRRFGRFVPVGRALADLNTLAVERRNGSHLDVALAQADALLAAAPDGHARRVLLLSDLRTRAALDVSKLAGAFRRSGALLHVAHIEEGRPVALAPDAEGGWSDVARRTGGLLWNATLAHGAGEAPNGEMAATLEELARPVRIHHFRAAASWINVASDDVLNEGQGIASLEIARDLPPSLEIAGELWAKPIRVRLSPDPAASRLWSALVFGSDLMDQLDEKEMMVLARHGGAVSPVTSYLAIEPGVRPSTEGIPRDGQDTALGGMGEGNIELGNLGTVGRAAGGAFDHAAWLRKAVEPARKRCGFAGRAVTVGIETTIDEIVDIPALTADGLGDRACLREAVWSIELPVAFKADHEKWTVRFDP